MSKHLVVALRRLALAGLVGAVVGGVAVGLDAALAAIRAAGVPPAGAVAGESTAWWAVVVVLAAGQAVAVWLARRFAPEVLGAGSDGAIAMYYGKGPTPRLRTALWKWLCSVVTVGAGGSGGRQGPMVQIGANLGGWLARHLDPTTGRDPQWLLVGIAGGVGGIFQAPCGGALLAVEVVHRTMPWRWRALPAALAASWAGAGVHGWFAGPPVLAGLVVRPIAALDYAAMVVLGVGLVPVVAAYVMGVHGVRGLVERAGGARPGIAALGGVVTALAALATEAVTGGATAGAILGQGTGFVLDQLAAPGLGRAGLLCCLAVIAGKLVATAATIGTGGSAGLFAPALVLGAAAGGAFAALARQLGLPVEPGLCVVAGMVGVFSGAAKTPLAMVVMAVEMTDGLGYLLPLALVAGVTSALSGNWHLFPSQLAGPGAGRNSPAQV